MTPGEIGQIVFTGFVGAGISMLVWTQIRDLRKEMRADISTLRDELKRDMSELRHELAIMRSDLTQVALAVGARSRAAND